MDFIDDVNQHLLQRIPVIGVYIAPAKNRVNHIAAPVHLQGVELLDLLLSRLNALAFPCIIIFKYHRIDTKLNDIGTCLPESPDEKPLQQTTKQIIPHKREPPKKTFHRVR